MYLPPKTITMKKLLIMLLLTSGVYAQVEVFNVQHYCVDSKPFRKGDCDIAGNEYSFVYLDTKKKDVVFFLTDIEIKYKIIASYVEVSPNAMSYTLENEKGITKMKVYKQKRKIEFIDAFNHIYLTVGKSTKSE